MAVPPTSTPTTDARPHALLVLVEMAVATEPPTATAMPAMPVTTATPSRRRKTHKTPKAAKPKPKKLHLRTRELVRFRVQNLELDLMHLRQEIADLERTRRHLLYARALNRADDAVDGSVLKTIREFYALMRHGYNDVVWLDERPLDFRRFIRTTFDEALAVGPDSDLSRRAPHGRDQFVQHLCHMTALTGSPNVQTIEMQIHATRDGTFATVVVKTVCTSPLSASMLEAKYAHVGFYPELQQKLVGRVISAYGEARYVFDLTTGRIVLADLHADHAAAILQVVDTADEYEILYSGNYETVVTEIMEPLDVAAKSQVVVDHRQQQTSTERRRPPATMSLEFLLC